MGLFVIDMVGFVALICYHCGGFVVALRWFMVELRWFAVGFGVGCGVGLGGWLAVGFIFGGLRWFWVWVFSVDLFYVTPNTQYRIFSKAFS